MKTALSSLMLWPLCVALVACDSVPTAPTKRPGADVPAQPVEPDGVRAFETLHRERALALELQGALLEAAQTWEVLALLNPVEYGARAAALQPRIEARAQEHLLRARQEFKRGDLTAAEMFYLSVIALQPANKEATDALRTVERARSREHLLKAGRALPPAAEASGKRPSATAPAAIGNPLLMEQASNLARQGDFDDAIELLQGQIKAVPNDSSARDLLADLLYKKSQTLQARDAAASQAALKRCMQVSPKHACNAAAAASASRAASTPRP